VLDVIANIQPLWTYLDPMNAQLIEPRIGSKRNNQQYQLASLQRSGARIGYGSDWPVTSYLPLDALAVPTHRSAPGSTQAWSPQESVSLEDSLAHYTTDAAYSNFWNKGMIAVGMDADFVVLDQNPLKVAPMHVSEITVLQVYLGGVPWVNS
jgi:predicted amidohydrolase YtcJ